MSVLIGRQVLLERCFKGSLCGIFATLAFGTACSLMPAIVDFISVQARCIEPTMEAPCAGSPPQALYFKQIVQRRDHVLIVHRKDPPALCAGDSFPAGLECIPTCSRAPASHPLNDASIPSAAATASPTSPVTMLSIQCSP
jgi:hypothetical protein